MHRGLCTTSALARLADAARETRGKQPAMWARRSLNRQTNFSERSEYANNDIEVARHRGTYFYKRIFKEMKVIQTR